MNEIFSFRKELNMKKIIIIVLIILIILGVILWKVFSPSEESISIKPKIESTETEFFSKNQVFSLTLPNSYNFIQSEDNQNYILELKNKDNLNIFVAEENLVESLPLLDLVESDLKSYASQFKNTSDISNISEIDRGGTPAYTYSLHYLDTNTKTAFYLQTIWIEYNDKYYIIDIEFPLSTLSENSKIINEILNSIVIK